MTEFLQNQDYNLFINSNPFINDCVVNFKLNVAKKTICLIMKETKTFDVLKWVESLPIESNLFNADHISNEGLETLGLSISSEKLDAVPSPQDFELPNFHDLEHKCTNESISIFFNEKLEENSKTNNVLISINGIALIDHNISFEKFLTFVPDGYGIDPDLSQDSEHNIELRYETLKVLDKNIKM